MPALSTAPKEICLKKIQGVQNLGDVVLYVEELIAVQRVGKSSARLEWCRCKGDVWWRKSVSYHRPGQAVLSSISLPWCRDQT